MIEHLRTRSTPGRTDVRSLFERGVFEHLFTLTLMQKVGCSNIFPHRSHNAPPISNRTSSKGDLYAIITPTTNKDRPRSVERAQALHHRHLEHAVSATNETGTSTTQPPLPAHPPGDPLAGLWRLPVRLPAPRRLLL